MSEAAPNSSELSGQTGRNEEQEPAPNTWDILGEIERFSRLSCDLKDCLSAITRKIIDSLSELKTVRQALAWKKEELKELCGMETSAAALMKLQEEHRLKQSEFEDFIENRRRLWEEEQERMRKEDEEYRRALGIRRREEEEAFRSRLDREMVLGRQKLEEELRQVRQQEIEKQESLKRDLAEREQALERKELEWIRMIRELELLMTRLMEQTRKKSPGTEPAAAGCREDAAPPCGAMEFGVPSVPEKNAQRRENPGIALEPAGDDIPSLAPVRGMLFPQRRGIENIQADWKDNREPLPFRLPPKDTI
ncbi:MAG: hypothetical protein JW793_12080 [Acidobacteria bacterium]|nr:hypothetical protein [Acidobacteriota bacterium]